MNGTMKAIRDYLVCEWCGQWRTDHPDFAPYDPDPKHCPTAVAEAIADGEWLG